MIPPLFVSFFTANYAAEADGLVESLKRLGIDHHVCEEPDQGSWLRNIHHKASFLRRMRERHPQRPLVWVDSDARVLSKPRLLLGMKGPDFAAHWFRPDQMAGGTLFLAATHASYELVRRWQWRIEHHGRDLSDQTSLQVEAEAMPGLNVYRLPPELCFIHDLSAAAYPGVEPVILHGQASRRLQ